MTGTVMTPAFGEATNATTIATSSARPRRVHGVACTTERMRFLACSIFGVEGVHRYVHALLAQSHRNGLADAAT